MHISDRVKWWNLLGPCFLMAAAYICFFRYSRIDWPLLAAGMGGLLIWGVWKTKGLFLSLTLIAAAVLLETFHGDAFWVAMLGASLSVSLILAHIAGKRSKQLIHGIVEENRSAHERIGQLEQLLKETQQFAIQEKKEAQKQIEELQDAARQSVQLLDQLNDARVDRFQLEVLHEAALKQVKAKDKQLSLLREQIGRISDALTIATSQEFWGEDTDIAVEVVRNPRIEHVYLQLKQQFEDKSEVLHQTRKELFLVENQLLALQKECEQNANDLNPSEVMLTEHLREVEEECKDLELQVECLQELVTELIGKKKGRKPRKPKNIDRALELSFD